MTQNKRPAADARTCDRRHGMDPRVKPWDDEERGALRLPVSRRAAYAPLHSDLTKTPSPLTLRLSMVSDAALPSGPIAKVTGEGMSAISWSG
jgi:hypothetical protein